MSKVLDYISKYMYFSATILGNKKRIKRLVSIYQRRNARCCFPQDIQHAVVQMFLKETTYCGGLSDRLRGAVSIYQECKLRGLPFKIYYEALELADYLEPNEYDWRIDEKDLSFDLKEVYPCTILCYDANLKNKMMQFVQQAILRYFLKKQFKQIHVYSNMATGDEEYYELHRELFKPSTLLQQHIDRHLQAIGGERSYIAMVFRFRSLMGDFEEGGETLCGEEREAYKMKCVDCVKRMHKEHPNTRILVTSDSTTFLSALKDLEDIYVIPGKVVHMSITFDADKLTYMKSFLDYYMLSYASTIYLVLDKKMYHSGFGYRAAKLGGCEYKEIEL